MIVQIIDLFYRNRNFLQVIFLIQGISYCEIKKNHLKGCYDSIGICSERSFDIRNGFISINYFNLKVKIRMVGQ